MAEVNPIGGDHLLATMSILLIYTFLPSDENRVTAYQTGSIAASSNKLSPDKLPEIVPSLRKTGKMPARKAF
jgi:hypothetical protein